MLTIPLLVGVLGACAPAEPAAAPAPGAPPPPIPLPRPGIRGCVESPELSTFVRALDAHRESARRDALAALGAHPEQRTGTFGAGPAPLDGARVLRGRRQVVAAQVSPQFEPRASLARQGSVLRRIEERPRAHAVSVLSCGVQRCSRAALKPSASWRPVWIELAPAERWGQPLALAYEFWWADVRYPEREEPCPVEGEAGAASTGAASAASATP